MICDICDKRTSINWGNAYGILCETCYGTRDGKLLLQQNQKKGELITHREDFHHDDNYSFKTLFNFEGRITRRTFWAIFLLQFIIGLGLEVVTVLNYDSNNSFSLLLVVILIGIIYIPVAWVAIAAYIKRCHDINISGWLVLTFIIPIVNILVFLYLGFVPGTVGANQYGEDPI